MANKYDALAASIIQNVGGKENVVNLAHCFTRLRFTLKDESKVNQEELRKLQGVIQLIMAGGHVCDSSRIFHDAIIDDLIVLCKISFVKLHSL